MFSINVIHITKTMPPVVKNLSHSMARVCRVQWLENQLCDNVPENSSAAGKTSEVFTCHRNLKRSKIHDWCQCVGEKTYYSWGGAKKGGWPGEQNVILYTTQVSEWQTVIICQGLSFVTWIAGSLEVDPIFRRVCQKLFGTIGFSHSIEVQWLNTF